SQHADRRSQVEGSTAEVTGGEGERQDAERYGHPDRADEQQGLAAQLIDEEYRDQAGRDRESSGEDVDLERVRFTESHGLPQYRPVVEHHVDADELLKGREPDPDPHDTP